MSKPRAFFISRIAMKAIKETDKVFLAALKFAVATIGDRINVPPGRHDLSRVLVAVQCPDGAAVDRIEGANGDGTEPVGAADAPSLAAVLLLIERKGFTATAAEWKQACIDAVLYETKPKEHVPAECHSALHQIEEELPKDCKRRKATNATRIGAADAKILVSRMTIAEFEGRPPLPRRRAVGSRA